MPFPLRPKNVRIRNGICPRGMIYSLIICTDCLRVACIGVDGNGHYTKLNVGDPLAMVFDARGLKFIGGIVAVSAIIATASVFLVFQLGQPRIWMSMSRDGLLPKIFSRIHPQIWHAFFFHHPYGLRGCDSRPFSQPAKYCRLPVLEPYLLLYWFVAVYLFFATKRQSRRVNSKCLISMRNLFFLSCWYCRYVLIHECSITFYGRYLDKRYLAHGCFWLMALIMAFLSY